MAPAVDGRSGTTRHMRGASAGFAGFFAWFLITVFGAQPLHTATSGGLLPNAGQTGLFIGLLAVSLAVYAAPRRVQKLVSNLPFAAMCVALCMIATSAPVISTYCITLYTQKAAPFVFVESCSGFAAGALACLGFLAWHLRCTNTARGGHLRYESVSCALGSLASAAVLAGAPALLWRPAAAAFLAFSFTAYCATHALASAQHTGESSKRSRKSIVSHLDPRFRALFFVLNFASGIAWYLVSLPFESTAYALLAGCMAMLALVLIAGRQQEVPDRYVLALMRACLGITIVAFLTLATSNLLASTAALCALVASWLVCWTVDLSLLLHQADEFEFSAVEHTAGSVILNNAGFFAGWCTCSVFGALQLLAAPTDMSVMVALAVLIALLGAWLMPFDSYASPDEVIAKEAEIARRRSEIKQGSDEASTRIKNVATRYELTKREQDVLVWLVCGRTAKTIAAELGVSESTAKTHIYNIYKKAGVHSQQDLIKLVEDL